MSSMRAAIVACLVTVTLFIAACPDALVLGHEVEKVREGSKP